MVQHGAPGHARLPCIPSTEEHPPMIGTLRHFVLAVAAVACMPVLAEQAWVARSNAHAQSLLAVMARYEPERVAWLGVDGHDTDILELKPGFDERFEADLERAARELEARETTTSDPRIRDDLQILVQAARDRVVTMRLRRKLMLPWFDLDETLFQGFRSLLDPRVDPKRYPAALVRLRRYIGRESGFEPVARLAQERSRERFATPGLTGPASVEVEQALANRQRYVEGIRQAFEKSGLAGWQSDFGTLQEQLAAHADWVREQILPRARGDNRLPPEIYADNLKNVGVRIDPQRLIDRALVGFEQTRDEMQAIARLVAAERKLPSGDYREVLRVLKRQAIPSEQLLALYRMRLAAIEAIVRREKIVTLPQRAAAIRLASEAESASMPAPFLDPPRLIGNTGEPATFVLPLANPNAPSGATMDDFTYDAITWALTAHEARPGHELQFARMLEAGVSIARAVFAFNSANVEGWALYAEALMKPYLPLDGQLAALQMRLMRAARAFLDPMIALGRITPEDRKSTRLNSSHHS